MATERADYAPRLPANSAATATQRQPRRPSGAKRHNVALNERDQLQRGLDIAGAYLAVRPRSEDEVRRRLSREELPPPIMDQVIQRLMDLHLLSDTDFAQYWIDQRRTFRPRGARLLAAELRQHGVGAEIVTQAVRQTDEAESEDAYRAADRKAGRMAALDEHLFKTRLAEFLTRRGFNWEATRSAVERQWRARASRQGSDIRPRERPANPLETLGSSEPWLPAGAGPVALSGPQAEHQKVIR